MNERIKQLIDQMDQSGFPYQASDNSMTVTTRDLEYFAELIVQECAEVIDNGRFSAMECEGNSHRVSYNNGIYYALSSVKKHFGVEE
jgi:hypothetical protein